jgi:uncharacterized membrane protein YbhN (UPF0104 family)
MKKWLLFLLKLVFTVGCLWWAFSGIDFKHSVFAHPQDLRWQWIAGGIVLGGATVFLSALRWWLLLRAQGIMVGLWRITELTLIGNLFNLFAVGGVGGDAAKIFLLIREHPERKLAVTMSVLVDHLVGLVAMAIVFFAMTAGRFEALESQSVLGKGTIHFAWVFFSGGLAFVALFFLMASPWVHDRIHKGGKRMPKWEVLRRVPEIYDVYRKKWGHALTALAVSTVMLPVYYATFWCGASSIHDGVDPLQVFSAMPVVDAMGAMPVSISGIGVREKTFEILMNDLAGLPAEVAVSGSLIGFACSLVWAALGGILFLRPSDRTPMKQIEDITHAEAEA